jgi:hypothetical protein
LMSPMSNCPNRAWELMPNSSNMADHRWPENGRLRSPAWRSRQVSS